MALDLLLRRYLIAILALLAWSSPCFAEEPQDIALYDIPPGTTLSNLKANLGEPSVRMPFEDGWVALIYQFKGHNVIVETAPDDPEYIVAVQIAGDFNPPGKGLLGINLGDNFKEPLYAFGLPVSKRPSIDEKTREPIQDAWIYQYNAVSFEVRKNIITSIKVHYPGRKVTNRGRTTISAFPPSPARVC